jgi:hypothetical protein
LPRRVHRNYVEEAAGMLQLRLNKFVKLKL